MTTTSHGLPPTATTTPPDVLAVALDDRLLGQEMLLAAARLDRRGSVALADAAIVSIDRKGRPRITQTRDMNPSQGALVGAWWGSLIGLLALGLPGWLLGAAAGAGLGWWRASRRDIGVPDAWMRDLAGRLLPGEVAAVFQMRDVYPTHLLRELRRFDGRLLAATIGDTSDVDIEDALAYQI